MAGKPIFQPHLLPRYDGQITGRDNRAFLPDLPLLTQRGQLVSQHVSRPAADQLHLHHFQTRVEHPEHDRHRDRPPAFCHLLVRRPHRRIDRGLAPARPAKLSVWADHDLFAGQDGQDRMPFERRRYIGHRPHSAEPIAGEKTGETQRSFKFAPPHSPRFARFARSKFEYHDDPLVTRWQRFECLVGRRHDLLIHTAGQWQCNGNQHGWRRCESGRQGPLRWSRAAILVRRLSRHQYRSRQRQQQGDYASRLHWFAPFSHQTTATQLVITNCLGIPHNPSSRPCGPPTGTAPTEPSLPPARSPVRSGKRYVRYVVVILIQTGDVGVSQVFSRNFPSLRPTNGKPMRIIGPRKEGEKPHESAQAPEGGGVTLATAWAAP